MKHRRSSLMSVFTGGAFICLWVSFTPTEWMRSYSKRVAHSNPIQRAVRLSSGQQSQPNRRHRHVPSVVNLELKDTIGHLHNRRWVHFRVQFTFYTTELV